MALQMPHFFRLLGPNHLENPMSRILLLPCLALIALLLLAPQTRAQQSLDGWPDWVQERMQDEVAEMTFGNVECPTTP